MTNQELRIKAIKAYRAIKEGKVEGVKLAVTVIKFGSISCEVEN